MVVSDQNCGTMVMRPPLPSHFYVEPRVNQENILLCALLSIHPHDHMFMEEMYNWDNIYSRH